MKVSEAVIVLSILSLFLFHSDDILLMILHLTILRMFYVFCKAEEENEGGVLQYKTSISVDK
jgi:hypothetical protein